MTGVRNMELRKIFGIRIIQQVENLRYYTSKNFVVYGGFLGL
jgi:predicted transcriptional regulator